MPRVSVASSSRQKCLLIHAGAARPRLTLSSMPKVEVPWSRPKAPCVFDLAFHPSGQWLATACGDHQAYWWDADTGANRAAIDCRMGKVTAVAFSPNGRRCAAGGEGGRVAVWDV